MLWKGLKYDELKLERSFFNMRRDIMVRPRARTRTHARTHRERKREGGREGGMEGAAITWSGRAHAHTHARTHALRARAHTHGPRAGARELLSLLLLWRRLLKAAAPGSA